MKAVMAEMGGEAIAQLPFFIEAPEGRMIFGYTDMDGKLPRIRTAHVDQLVILWGGGRGQANGEARP